MKSYLEALVCTVYYAYGSPPKLINSLLHIENYFGISLTFWSILKHPVLRKTHSNYLHRYGLISIKYILFSKTIYLHFLGSNSFIMFDYTSK